MTVGWRLGPDHTDTCCADGVPFIGTVRFEIRQGRFVAYHALSTREGPKLVGPNYYPPPGPMGWLLVAYGLPLILALMARLLAGRGAA